MHVGKMMKAISFTTRGNKKKKNVIVSGHWTFFFSQGSTHSLFALFIGMNTQPASHYLKH